MLLPLSVALTIVRNYWFNSLVHDICSSYTFVVMGQRASGKSTVVRKLVTILHKRRRNFDEICLFDRDLFQFEICSFLSEHMPRAHVRCYTRDDDLLKSLQRIIQSQRTLFEQHGPSAPETLIILNSGVVDDHFKFGCHHVLKHLVKSSRAMRITVIFEQQYGMEFERGVRPHIDMVFSRFGAYDYMSSTKRAYEMYCNCSGINSYETFLATLKHIDKKWCAVIKAPSYG